MADAFRRELEFWEAESLNKTRVRVIAPSWAPICTVGYAVTQRGAQKLLYTIGNEGGVELALDLAMAKRIQSGHLRSLTVVPPLITPWKTGTNSDSDIKNLADIGVEYARGSENLRRSGRAALAATLGRRIEQEG